MNTIFPLDADLPTNSSGSTGRVFRVRPATRASARLNNLSWQCRAAFARIELLAVLAALGMVAIVAFPGLATPRPRTARIVCANNLRQIAVALQLWANDRADRFPWEVPVGEGGTMVHPLAPNTWLHFAWISNELATPKILLCPSDTGEPARDFGSSPDGGYVHPNFASRATSYFLSHGNVSRLNPVDIVGGDRNFGSDGSGGCARFGTVQLTAQFPPSSNYAWNTNLHYNAGNLIRLDGRVDQVSNKALRDAALARPPNDGPANLHFVAPR